MIELSTFTPAEAARITGVNVTLQRDWRRRDFLPKEKGHARFDVYGIAELAALEALSKRSIGPQQARPIIRELATGIALGALSKRTSWSGDADFALSWNPEEFEVISQYAVADRAEEAWNIKARWLSSRALMNSAVPDSRTKVVMFWWADESVSFHNSLSAPFDFIEYGDARLNGAVIMLDMWGIGQTIADRAAVPFASFNPPAGRWPAVDRAKAAQAVAA